MADNGDIWLGLLGSEEELSPGGRKLRITDVEISRSDRTADGTLRTDIIATKMQFTLDYSIIDGTALLQFINLYRLHSDLSLLIYVTSYATMTNEDGDPITVQMRPIERERLEMRGDGTWTGCTIILDEV